MHHSDASAVNSLTIWRGLVTNKLVVQDVVLHYQGNTLVLSIKIIRLHQGAAQQVKFVIARLRQICFLEADYFPASVCPVSSLGSAASFRTNNKRCVLYMGWCRLVGISI